MYENHCLKLRQPEFPQQPLVQRCPNGDVASVFVPVPMVGEKVFGQDADGLNKQASVALLESVAKFHPFIAASEISIAWLK